MFVDQADVFLGAAMDDLADRVGGEVDRREERSPKHVAQTFADRLKQIGLVGEMPVDLGFCGAGLFGDLSDAEVGPEPVDGAKRRLDDLSAHLLTVLAPAFAARVPLDPRLW